MKKKYFLVALAAMMAVNGFAQTVTAAGKFTPQEQGKCNLALLARIDQINRQRSAMTRSSQAEPQVKVLVEMQENETADVLKQYGVQVVAQYDNFASLNITPSQLAQVAADSRVAHINLPSKAKLYLAKAGRLSGVDRVHSGDGLQQPYTGKGVLALIEDGGFQIDHPMMKRKDGSTKVEWLNDKNGNQYTTEEEMKTVEFELISHGAHTSSILVGEAVTGADGRVYQGVAPGASIAMSEMDSQDEDNLFDNLVRLANYADLAKNQDRPKVMSLSVGGEGTAWSDGEDVACKFLSKIAEKYPVCISSGNSGDADGGDAFFHEVCQPGRNKFMVRPTQEPSAWGSSFLFATFDEKPLKFTFYIYDEDWKLVAKLPTLEGITNGEPVYISALPSDQGEEGVITNEVFAEKFGGSIAFRSKIGEGGRYQALLDFQGVQNIDSDDGYKLMLAVEGEDGQTIKGSAESSGAFDFIKIAGVDLDGAVEAQGNSADGNVNSLAVAKNVIAIGSYDNDDTAKVSSFSSYAIMPDGSTMPFICAPGNVIVAAEQRSYKLQDEEKELGIKGSEDKLVGFSGTSMSTPYAAGIVALWLEADPKLSVADVKDIMVKTANAPTYAAKTEAGKEAEKLKWGHGGINAYNGLKEVLNRATAILRPVADGKDFMFRQYGKEIEAYVAGENSLTARLYSLDGRIAAQASQVGNQVTLHAGTVPAGVYVLEVQGVNTSHQAKIVIK